MRRVADGRGADTQMVPPQVEEIFRRVQDGAHYMPDWQTEVCSSSCYLFITLC